jgi:hypothetical protein
MPWWGWAIVGLTTLGFILLSASIEYTIRLLVVNLAIIESPKSTASQHYTLLAEDEGLDAPLDKKQVELVDVDMETTQTSDKPMTGNIRKTVRHITTIGGFRARWRGIRIFALYQVLMAMITAAITSTSLFGPIGSPLVGSLVAALVTSSLHCAWTHKTITMPSNKKLTQRLATRKQVMQLLAPTTIKTIAVEVTYLATVLVVTYSFHQINDMARTDEPNRLLGVMLSFAPLATVIAGFVLLVLPSYVILIRVEASLLPEEEETIVPMDRSFGGLLTSASDKLSILGAWKSFNGTGRVVKLYLKFFLISIALSLFFGHLLFFEIWAIMGDKLVVLLMSLRAVAEIQATVGV